MWAFLFWVRNHKRFWEGHFQLNLGELWGGDKSKGHTQMSEVSHCRRKETLIHGSGSSVETIQATYTAFSYANDALCAETAMQSLKKTPRVINSYLKCYLCFSKNCGKILLNALKMNSMWSSMCWCYKDLFRRRKTKQCYKGFYHTNTVALHSIRNNSYDSVCIKRYKGVGHITFTLASKC